ncbi:MAG: beta-ketoacyl-[acyl-carrier-protein] synthase family protein [Kiritimatiellaeota bacterium]|nr:beta-ketoacyl-[acyl-carrier-protein] synthase family protein [Kiritimatiellota bacterium]
MKERRVVVTGMGCVSPLGYGARRLFDGILDNESAVEKMPEWSEYDGLHSLLAAPCEIRGEKDIPRKFRRSMSPMSVMATQAAEEALANAGVSKGEIRDDRCGCVTGSTMGSAKVINQAYELVLPEKDFTTLTSMMFFKCMAHSVSANLASYFSFQGAVMSTSAACASSLQAIGTGYDMIRCARQDIMLCGGAEEIHPTVTGIFDLLYATSVNFNDEPEATPRPFDSRRDGLVCGEGAAILVLEDYARASARNADILCEITGYNTGGSGDHVSQSNSEAMIRCMNGAMRDAGVGPDDIDYLNAHATGTIQGDAAEAAAIGAVFADKVPVSSLKGYIGHTMGASGAMELAASLLMMREGMCLPGRNLEIPGEDCSAIRHLKGIEERDVSRIMKNSFAFGGVNASIVCERV